MKDSGFLENDGNLHLTVCLDESDPKRYLLKIIVELLLFM